MPLGSIPPFNVGLTLLSSAFAVFFSQRADRFLRMAGFSEQYLDLACQQILNAAERLLTPWIATLPALMQQDLLLHARRQLWSHGLVDRDSH